MVDEFQDTNRVQLALVEAFAAPIRGCSQSATRTSRSIASATPSSRSFASGAGWHRSPRTPRCCRCAATSARSGRARRGQRDRAHAARRVRRAHGGPPGIRGPRRDRAASDPRRRARRERAQVGRGRHRRRLEPPPGGSGTRIVAEARFLAERLRRLVDSGDARRGDIAVLLRAFTHVDAYEEALRRAGRSRSWWAGAATGPSSRSRI